MDVTPPRMFSGVLISLQERQAVAKRVQSCGRHREKLQPLGGVFYHNPLMRRLVVPCSRVFGQAAALSSLGEHPLCPGLSVRKPFSGEAGHLLAQGGQGWVHRSPSMARHKGALCWWGWGCLWGLSPGASFPKPCASVTVPRPPWPPEPLQAAPCLSKACTSCCV